MRSSGASSTHPLEALKREGPSAPRASLHSLVAGAGNDIELLLARQVDELHGIAGDADGEVRVLGLFGVLHRPSYKYAMPSPEHVREHAAKS